MVAGLATPVAATKYAGEPYNLSVGGRALGRGGAFTASYPDASSVFWNIAALAGLRRPEVILQHTETFGSLLNHDFAGVAFPARSPGSWAWGLYGSYLGGGGILLTTRDSTTNRPVVTREARHSDWSFGVGLARRTERWWSWGMTAKVVGRDLPGNSAWGLGMDLALWANRDRYRIGIKAADITTTFLSYDSGRKETIVPHVNWGGEVQLPVFTDGLTGLLAVEAETYFENRRAAAQFWSGSISVDVHIGLEFGYRDLLFGRIGSDAGSLALGAGFTYRQWALDAAIVDHDFLDNTYRISLRWMLP